MALLTSELQRVGILLKINKCHFAWNVKPRVSKFQNHFLKSTFFKLQHFFCNYGYLFGLIFALSTFGDKEVKVLPGPFLRSKILWYAQNFQWVQNSSFPNGKHIFPQIIDKFLKFEYMEYLIHHVKFEMCPACVNSSSYNSES